jgi:hypothetical protein
VKQRRQGYMIFRSGVQFPMARHTWLKDVRFLSTCGRKRGLEARSGQHLSRCHAISGQPPSVRNEEKLLSENRFDCTRGHRSIQFSSILSTFASSSPIPDVLLLISNLPHPTPISRSFLHRSYIASKYFKNQHKSRVHDFQKYCE